METAKEYLDSKTFYDYEGGRMVFRTVAEEYATKKSIEMLEEVLFTKSMNEEINRNATYIKVKDKLTELQNQLPNGK